MGTTYIAVDERAFERDECEHGARRYRRRLPVPQHRRHADRDPAERRDAAGDEDHRVEAAPAAPPKKPGTHRERHGDEDHVSGVPEADQLRPFMGAREHDQQHDDAERRRVEQEQRRQAGDDQDDAGADARCEGGSQDEPRGRLDRGLRAQNGAYASCACTCASICASFRACTCALVRPKRRSRVAYDAMAAVSAPASKSGHRRSVK